MEMVEECVTVADEWPGWNLGIIVEGAARSQ